MFKIKFQIIHINKELKNSVNIFYKIKIILKIELMKYIE